MLPSWLRGNAGENMGARSSKSASKFVKASQKRRNCGCSQRRRSGRSRLSAGSGVCDVVAGGEISDRGAVARIDLVIDRVIALGHGGTARPVADPITIGQRGALVGAAI